MTLSVVSSHWATGQAIALVIGDEAAAELAVDLNDLALCLLDEGLLLLRDGHICNGYGESSR